MGDAHLEDSATTPAKAVPAGTGRPSSDGSGVRFGPVLCFWIGLMIVLSGAEWALGARTAALGEAVERGAERVESQGIGEVSEDLVRKAIQTQHETRPFWTLIALLEDFLAEPVALALRAIVTATTLSALAAALGRPVRYELALAQCSAAQGFWVAGLAAHVLLVALFRRSDVETSAAVLLGAGSYPAATVLTLRQLDPFSLLGWIALARGGWRRRQVGLPAAIAVALILALTEAYVRIALGLTIGAAMRLELVPEQS